MEIFIIIMFGMNTYLIGGVKAYGVNLKSAAESIGFTNVRVFPKWRGKSNGLYYVRCNEKSITHCEWVEKRIELGFN